jgi:hypothetical protein
MQWPTVLARPDFLVSLPGLRERELARERDYATQFRIEARKPLQVEIRKPLRRQFSLLDPARELRDRREGNVCVGCRKLSGIILGPDKSVAHRPSALAGQNGVPLRIRSEGRFQPHLARPGASLV